MDTPKVASHRRTSFRLATLFIAVTLAAIFLAIGVPLLRGRANRQEKLQFYHLIGNPGNIGRSIKGFPQLYRCTDKVFNETALEAKLHLDHMVSNWSRVQGKLKMPTPPVSNFRIYFASFEESLQMSEPCWFAVITHNGVIVYVDSFGPAW